MTRCVKDELREICEITAPCGIDCKKCIAFSDGYMKETSTRLMESLGPNFDAHAKRFSKFYPIMKNYLSFKEMTQFLWMRVVLVVEMVIHNFPIVASPLVRKLNLETLIFVSSVMSFRVNDQSFIPV